MPKEFERLQKGPNPTFGLFRPPEAAASIPITLLHPVFAQFDDDCENHTPTAEDNALVFNLSNAMSRFYLDEKGRETEFRRILTEYGIELTASHLEGSQCRTDGDMRWKGLCFVILEVKNELACGMAEPLFEALFYFVRSMRKFSEQNDHARLPCIIIYLCGTPLNS
jgi:hypothetical protein